jgi:hypothetical protein
VAAPPVAGALLETPFEPPDTLAAPVPPAFVEELAPPPEATAADEPPIGVTADPPTPASPVLEPEQVDASRGSVPIAAIRAIRFIFAS